MVDRYSIRRLRQGGLSFQNYLWGQAVTGTREALIEAGIVPVGGFPGDPGARRHTAKSHDANGREVRVKTRGKYLFEARREWTPEEQAAYHAEQARLDADKRERDYADSIVRSWPKTAMEFREDASRTAEQALRLLEAFVFRDGERGGWRYDEANQLQFQILADQVRQLVQGGRVVLDRQLREEHTPTCIAKSVKALDRAKSDKGFQRFIAGLSG